MKSTPSCKYPVFPEFYLLFTRGKRGPQSSVTPAEVADPYRQIAQAFGAFADCRGEGTGQCAQ
ncbi:hypothetical protein [Rhizobium rhizosphaerae]|uniref:hypothetical protein n=1 Tax=Xaviernesmea rhizosphaerae TaxID=1672749 RepID=UPI000A60DBAC|nr:hypothetical protein [Xaviernesmea rhizosphaerae]